MKKTIVLVELLFITTLAQAQKSLYEALEVNGETSTCRF